MTTGCRRARVGACLWIADGRRRDETGAHRRMLLTCRGDGSCRSVIALGGAQQHLDLGVIQLRQRRGALAERRSPRADRHDHRDPRCRARAISRPPLPRLHQCRNYSANVPYDAEQPQRQPCRDAGVPISHFPCPSGVLDLMLPSQISIDQLVYSCQSVRGSMPLRVAQSPSRKLMNIPLTSRSCTPRTEMRRVATSQEGTPSA